MLDVAPGRRLLDGLQLSLAAGEVVVVDGEDGCGASTLLRVLAGEQPADAGTVTGRGALLGPPPGDEWDDADVAGELAAPADLAALGLRSPPDREMWMLSAGERQRVRLARVLADPAPVLLLDEPLAALDAAGVHAVLEQLRGRAAAASGLLVVAKGDPRAARVADRVLWLADGRLGECVGG